MSSPSLPRVAPESVGVSSSNLLAFVDAVDRDNMGLHSLMVMRRGAVIAEGWWEPYRQDDVHLLYSLSKSFTSTAIGLAVEEGLLSLDDAVMSIFPEQTPPEPSENLKAMKVRHLLTMTCGHDKDDISDMYAREDGSWIRGFLSREVPFEPGMHFLYNSSASYVLSAIIQKLTHLTTLDYLRPRLLDPIGINHATWEVSPEGVSMGGWGMSITTEAIARFGQLYLQKGVWNGQSLLPEAWVEDATRFHVSNASNDQVDWQQGYGFQFWRCQHDGFRGDGAFGQFCVVIPSAELVVAITSAVDSMQAVLNLVWEHILGPIQSEPLPPGPESHSRLVQKLGHLALPGPSGSEHSPLEATISGKIYFRNEVGTGIQSCQFDFAPTGCHLKINSSNREFSIAIGHREWVHGVSSFEVPDQKIATRGAWVSDKVYEVNILAVESPSATSIVCEFDGNTVDLRTTLLHRFGPSEGPTFHGMADSSA